MIKITIHDSMNYPHICKSHHSCCLATLHEFIIKNVVGPLIITFISLKTFVEPIKGMQLCWTSLIFLI